MVMTHLHSRPHTLASFFVGNDPGDLDLPEAALDYCALFEQTPRSLALFRTDGRILAVNPAYTAFWDIGRQQIPADYNILLDPQLEANGVLPLIQRAFAGEVTQLPPMHYDVGSMTGGAGCKRWFLGVVYPVKDAAGSIQFMAMIHTDVTLQIEEKLASDAVARREVRHMQEILSSTADGVIMVDRQWRFTYANQQARDLISNGNEIVGLDLRDSYPLISEAAWQQLRKAMTDREPVEFQNFYPEPIHRWFRLRAFPVEEGISIFFQDCTEHRLAEKSVRENEKLAVAGRLAASIAHEINNPLESITNLLYLLEMEDAESVTSLQYIHLAQQELRRVAHITVNTLQYFRPAVLTTVTSLQELTQSVLTLFQGRIRHSGVHVESRFRNHPPFECIASEVRQIMANFLGNALDATASGGRIRIRIRPAHHPGSRAPGILFTMADTGCGMSRKTLDHLYEAFYTTKEASGTGIGLWVSHELIRKHHGYVLVKSWERLAPGRLQGGTVFQIFLPFASRISPPVPGIEAAVAAAIKLSALTSHELSHPNG